MVDPSVLFLGREDGTFVDRAKAARIVSPGRGRGAAVVDLNLDGLLDVVQVNRRDQAQVWRNVGRGKAKKPRPMGDWLEVELQQQGPNRDAIGAWIEVREDERTFMREVTVGGGHAGGQLGPIHFGLGAAAPKEGVEVRVLWPDGEQGPWQRVGLNRRVTIDRSGGVVLD